MATYTILWTAESPFEPDEISTDGATARTDGDGSNAGQSVQADTINEQNDSVLLSLVQSLDDKPDPRIDRTATPRRVTIPKAQAGARRYVRPPSDIRRSAPIEDRPIVAYIPPTDHLAEPDIPSKRPVRLTAVAVGTLSVVILLSFLFEPVGNESPAMSIALETGSLPAIATTLGEDATTAPLVLETTAPQVASLPPVPDLPEIAWDLAGFDTKSEDPVVDGTLRRAVPATADGLHEVFMPKATPAMALALLETTRPQVAYLPPSPVLPETSWDLAGFDTKSEDTVVDGTLRRAVPATADTLNAVFMPNVVPAMASALPETTAPQVAFLPPSPVLPEISWDLAGFDAEWEDTVVDGTLRRAVPATADALHEVFMPNVMPAMALALLETTAPRAMSPSPVAVSGETRTPLGEPGANMENRLIEDITARAVAALRRDSIPRQENPAKRPTDL